MDAVSSPASSPAVTAAPSPDSRVRRLIIRYGDLFIRPCTRAVDLDIAIAAAILGIVAWFFLDSRIVSFMHNAGVDDFIRKYRWTDFLRWPGHFLFTLPVAVTLGWTHRWRAQTSCVLLLAAFISGSNELFKWIIGRCRPDHLLGQACFTFEPFTRTPHGHSMPSGDASLAFATAAALAWMMPRGRRIFFVVAAIACLHRLAANAHHLSDVCAGVVLGLASFHLAHKLCTLVGARTAAHFRIEKPTDFAA